MNKGKIGIRLIAVLMMVFSMSSCKKSKQLPKTVKWYMGVGNKQALKERLQICKNNPAISKTTRTVSMRLQRNGKYE